MGAFFLWLPGGTDTRTDTLTQSLTFDVVTNEHPKFENQITDHVVEVGANVTDNVRVGLVSIDLDLFVSNEPIDTAEQYSSGGSLTNEKITTPDTGQVPIAFGGPLLLVPIWFSLPIGVPLVASLISSALNPVTVPIQAQAGTQANHGIQTGASVLTFPTAFDAVKQTHDQLEVLRTTAQLIQVVGTKGTYDNMEIESWDMERNPDTGSGATFTITLKQVRFVSTTTVAAPVSTKPAGAAAVSAGNQTTKDATPQSQSVLSFFSSLFQGLTTPTTVAP